MARPDVSLVSTHFSLLPAAREAQYTYSISPSELPPLDQQLEIPPGFNCITWTHLVFRWLTGKLFDSKLLALEMYLDLSQSTFVVRTPFETEHGLSLSSEQELRMGDIGFFSSRLVSPASVGSLQYPHVAVIVGFTNEGLPVFSHMTPYGKNEDGGNIVNWTLDAFAQARGNNNNNHQPYRWCWAIKRFE